MTNDLSIESLQAEVELRDLADESARGIAESRPWREIAKTAADIARDGVPDVQMDIAQILETTDGPLLMFGDSGSFKSWLALFICAAILNGAAFLGRATRRRPFVIYLNFDGGAIALERRVARMGIDDERFIVVSPPDGWNEAEVDALFACYPGAFVVIDCLVDVFVPDSTDVYGAGTRAFLKHLRRLYAQHGANGIIVDHAKRPDTSRSSRASSTSSYVGSHQKKAATRMMWSVDRVVSDDENRQTNSIIIRCTKMNELESFAPLRLTFDFSDGRVGIREDQPAPVEPAKLSAVEKEMVKQIDHVRAKGPTTAREVGAHDKGSRTKKTAWAKSRALGLLVPVGAETKPQKFDLAERANDHGEHHGDGGFLTAMTSEKPSNDEGFVQADHFGQDGQHTSSQRSSIARPREGVDSLQGDPGRPGRSPVGVGQGQDGQDAGIIGAQSTDDALLPKAGVSTGRPKTPVGL